jgi:hypothetical protein
MSTPFVIPVKQQELLEGAFVWNPESKPAVQLDPSFPHEEGYRLEILPEGIRITARTEAGAFYGQKTLDEYRLFHGDTLPCIRIEDWPEFAVRGVYYDVSRGKVPTLGNLKQLVDMLAGWKINQLQLYIENVFTFKNHPQIGRGWSPLTPDELLELQAYCKDRFITLMPSLTSFGHFEKILALPEYIHLAELPGHQGYPGGTTLSAVNPDSIQLVKELYDEFLPLFEADQANACGDEPWELGKGDSKAAVEEHGKGAVFIDYVLKLREIVQANGKQMQLWSDVVLEYPDLMDRFPKDIIMLNWEYSGDPENPGRMEQSHLFEENGFNWIAVPGISSWNTHCTDLPGAMSNIRSFAKCARAHGALGILNTHWGDNGARTPFAHLLHGFAYGAAISWNQDGTDDQTFTDTFAGAMFGPDSDAAAALIKSGGHAIRHSGKSSLYFCLIAGVDPNRAVFEGIDPTSPVRWQWSDVNGYLDEADPEKCAVVAEELTAVLDAIPPADSELLKELQLGVRMDHAACRKVVLTHRLRSGDPVAAAEWETIANEIDAIIVDFESNWLVRNKPSRLADNLTVLRRAAQEICNLTD